MTWSNLRRVVGCAALAAFVAYAGAATLMGSVALEAPVLAQTEGQVPGNALGNINDAELWRKVRRGVQGTVSIPDKNAAMLVQSEGDNWRAFRNGPISTYGGWLLLAMVVILALFFTFRGRIRIESGFSGITIERFNALERFAHWLNASSFVVLALTGLNVLYGKFVLMPVIGQSAFATLTLLGKLAHNYIGFAFIVGLVLMFVLWVKDNLPSKYDFGWAIRLGGLLSKGVHPPAKKFNFGQKVVFWGVILGGGSSAFTGIALMFPFEITPWGETFALLNIFGFGLPEQLTPLQEVQLSQAWHGIMGLVLTALIIGHIYIGSLGMEGAFDAVSTGQVDENWAREHHSVWITEIKGETSSPSDQQPAE